MSGLKQQIYEKAESAVKQMSSGTSRPLDFSRQSLVAVEELLAEASRHREDLDEEAIKAIIELLGSYILRVGHEEFGGAFLWTDKRDQPVLVVGEPDFHVAMISFDKVEGRLTGDEADNIPFFYEGFATRAAQQDPDTRFLFV